MKVSQFNKFVKWWWCVWMFVFMFFGVIIIGLQIIHILDSKTDFFFKDRIVEIPVYHQQTQSPPPICELDKMLNSWNLQFKNQTQWETGDRKFSIFISSYGKKSTTYQLTYAAEYEGMEIDVKKKFSTLDSLIIFIATKVEQIK